MYLNSFIAKDSEIFMDTFINFLLFDENKHVTRTKNLKENSRCNIRMEIKIAGILYVISDLNLSVKLFSKEILSLCIV